MAEKAGIAKSTMSEMVIRMRGELSRIAGARCEEFKVQQLMRRRFSVEHLGGNGQPDIIARKDGQVRVYSCKCLDYDKLKLLPPKEIAPEIHAARELGAALILSVHNLHDNVEREIPIDRDKVPDKIRLDMIA